MTKNLSKKHLFFTFFLVLTLLSPSTFSSSTLIAGKESSVEEIAYVPILMYHEIADNAKVNNRWTITPREFEEDLNYIKENGYQTVDMKDLLDYVDKRGKLPKKPIVLTFDDGLAGVYDYAYPLLRKYKMKAVLSVIGKITDEYSEGGPEDKNHYPHLSWTKINEMINSGCIELQNHSYNMHRSIGAKKRDQESLAEYKNRLSKDLSAFQDKIKEMTKSKPTTFVYPFGAYSKESKEILQELGFSASLGCYDIVNKVIAGNPECLYNLGRTLRTPGTSAESYFKKFQAASGNESKPETEDKKDDTKNNKKKEIEDKKEKKKSSNPVKIKDGGKIKQNKDKKKDK